MKSKKNDELNFLYLDDQYTKKGKKDSAKKKKTASKKTKSKKHDEKEDVFDFDKEIVIGVTKVPSQKEKKKQNKNQKQVVSKSKNQNIKKNKTTKGADVKSAPRGNKISKTSSKINGKTKKDITKKTKLIRGMIKWTILLSALIASFIFFMMSPLFDLAEISVTGNERIGVDTIISLSNLQIGENIYKTSSKKIEEKIKQNAYIESVSIKRNLPNKIQIEVKERKPTYMLEYANSFVYLNNQGYMLEISEQKLELPIITCYLTKEEDIKLGNQLCEEDLTRLQTVLKMTDSIIANNMGNLITKWDISNKQDYKAEMETEKKTIYFGDASNLSTKMLYLKAVLEDTKGLEGEIFVNGDFNKEKAFFRQKE